jgi:hypothetical protein
MAVLSVCGTSLQGQQSIEQPAEWIPLTVEVTETIGGAPRFYVEYRASDGSTRRERRDGSEIHLESYRLEKRFHFHGGAWTERPLRPFLHGGQPFMRLDARRVEAVAASDVRVQAVAALSALGFAVRFFEMRHGTGATIFCPELILLEVWSRRQAPHGLVERQVTHVALGEPQVEFRPPRDAAIVVH